MQLESKGNQRSSILDTAPELPVTPLQTLSSSLNTSQSNMSQGANYTADCMVPPFQKQTNCLSNHTL